jgi:hypothetical protein
LSFTDTIPRGLLVEPFVRTVARPGSGLHRFNPATLDQEMGKQWLRADSPPALGIDIMSI